MNQLQRSEADQIPTPYVDLALIRHGQSIYNGRKIVQGGGVDPANSLTSLGEWQAGALASPIQDLGIKPVGVWTSDLPRARQTCQINTAALDCDLPIVEDKRLREMCKGLAELGGTEGLTHAEVKTAEYRRQYAQEGWQFRHGSAESLAETAQEVGLRILAAMDDIADHISQLSIPPQPDSWPVGLVYSHGQAIRFGIGATLGWPPLDEVNQRYELDNCNGIIMRRYAAGRAWQEVGRIILLQASHLSTTPDHTIDNLSTHFST